MYIDIYIYTYSYLCVHIRVFMYIYIYITPPPRASVRKYIKNQRFKGKLLDSSEVMGIKSTVTKPPPPSGQCQKIEEPTDLKANYLTIANS